MKDLDPEAAAWKGWLGVWVMATFLAFAFWVVLVIAWNVWFR